MRIRQVALVARELQPAVDDITEVLGLRVAFNDPAVGKYGLENAVMPVGDTFLEVVAPVREGTTAGRYLERRGGDGGYMVLFQVPDVHAARARVREQGVRIVEEFDGERASATHLHPKDVPGAIVSLDAMYPPESWEWAGPTWREHVRTHVARGIVGVDIQADNPETLAKRWSDVLGLPAEREGSRWTIATDGGAINFVGDVDGRGEGLGAVVLAVAEPAGVIVRADLRGLAAGGSTVVMCGTRFRLVKG